MSKITGRVMDADTEDAIQDADVYLIDDSGKELLVLGSTDSVGRFEIEAPAFGQKIKIDFTGYQPVTLDPAYLGYDQRIGLTEEPSGTLADVVIKSTRKMVAKLNKKENYTLPIVLGSAAVVTFSIWLFKTYA